jgi:hypothetical protein
MWLWQIKTNLEIASIENMSIDTTHICPNDIIMGLNHQIMSLVILTLKFTLPDKSFTPVSNTITFHTLHANKVFVILSLLKASIHFQLIMSNNNHGNKYKSRTA